VIVTFADDMTTAAGALNERLGAAVVYRELDRADQTLTAIVGHESPEHKEDAQGRRFNRRSRSVRILKADLSAPMLTGAIEIDGDRWQIDKRQSEGAYWLFTVVRNEPTHVSRVGYQQY